MGLASLTQLLQKWVPLLGKRTYSMNFLVFENSFSIQIQFKSNSNQIHSFFGLLSSSVSKGQPELCGYYHLLQSCSSFFFRIHGQPELYARDHLLSNSFSSPRFNLLSVVRRSFSQCSVSDDLFYSPFVVFGSPSCSIFFASHPQPFFPLLFSL